MLYFRSLGKIYYPDIGSRLRGDLNEESYNPHEGCQKFGRNVKTGHKFVAESTELFWRKSHIRNLEIKQDTHEINIAKRISYP